jgi:hypothetical protein
VCAFTILSKPQFSLNLVDSEVGENGGALLGRDYLLQDQARVVLGG